MPVLRAHGITAAVPDGCDGRVFRRVEAHGARTYPVAQVASFPLPPDTADFGGGAVHLMGADDFLVVLFEYGPESVGRALFGRQGLPRSLPAGLFSTIQLRRGLPGHSGVQLFFTEQSRPFTLYAVVGSHARRTVVVPRVNRVLAGLSVDPPVAPGPAVAGATGWN